MSNLLDQVIAAHGGMEKWNSFSSVAIHLKAGGEIWRIKGKAGMFSDGIYEAKLHEQHSEYHSLLGPYRKSVWNPGQIFFVNETGDMLEELKAPRESFEGEKLETLWNDLQPHYFCNYAWWTYFTAPFNFTLPGYSVKELGPWTQDGEIWQRLEVTFPEHIETHNKIQVFYFDKDFLLKRHDYAPDILLSVPSSQYVWDYQSFSGIMIPVTRRIYLRNYDGSYNPDPVMVSIDVISVDFT